MDILASCDPVDLVLDEKVDQWDQGPKESASKILSISNCSALVRTESETARSPWNSRYDV